jgi:hypothetical protein
VLRVPATTFVITHSPSRFNRRDGCGSSVEMHDGRRSRSGCKLTNLTRCVPSAKEWGRGSISKRKSPLPAGDGVSGCGRFLGCALRSFRHARLKLSGGRPRPADEDVTDQLRRPRIPLLRFIPTTRAHSHLNQFAGPQSHLIVPVVVGGFKLGFWRHKPN